MRVLVTSAFGNQGRSLIPKLAKAGVTVRALEIAPEARDDLERLGAAEPVIGDMQDPDILKRACAGVDAVYHIGPNAHPRERELGYAVIAAAAAAGVRHFVYSSVLHPGITTLTQHLFKREVEEHLIGSGLNYTILRPSHYMQTLQYRHAFATDEFRLTWSLDRRQALIDVGDITAVAVKVLTERDVHFAATYELSSGECLTAYEIRDAIAEITGRATSVREVPTAEVVRTLFRDNPSEDLFEQRVRHFKVVAGWYSAHDFMGNPNVLTWLLGRAPTSLRDFLRVEYRRISA